MTNLTDNAPRPSRGPLEITVMPSKVGTAGTPVTIWQGSLVQEDGDGAVENATGVGTTAIGVAMQKGVSNSAIGTGPRIEVARRGVFLLPVAVSGNVARTTKGAKVYATDGNAFTTTSTSAQIMGVVDEVPESEVGLATGNLWVLVDPAAAREMA